MQKLLTVVILSFFLSGCSIKDFFSAPPAGLEINTNPKATVYLNDEHMGDTPYSNKNLKAGSYTLKLVPSDSSLSSYETKLNLTPKASTVISQTLSSTQFDRSGYILTFVEEPSGETFISFISDPDTINITLDDKPSGFTPISKLSVSPGTHTITSFSPGFLKQDITVNTVKGYNLIVNLKLAAQTLTLTPSPTPSPVNSPSSTISASPAQSPQPSPTNSKSTITPPNPIEKPYVLVNETETSWLRVRSLDSASSTELGKANTGEKLKYLGESTELGWHKIEFEGKVGWVSSKYTTLVK